MVSGQTGQLLIQFRVAIDAPDKINSFFWSRSVSGP